MDTLQLIAQFGFPIAAAVGIAVYVVKLNKDHRDDITAMTKAHREDIDNMTKSNSEKMDKLTEAINNNTIVMTRIYERLGVHDENT